MEEDNSQPAEPSQNLDDQSLFGQDTSQEDGQNSIGDASQPAQDEIQIVPEEKTAENGSPPVSTEPTQPTEEKSEISSPVSDDVRANAQASFLSNLLLRAKEKIQFNKRRKLDKILEFARQKGKITNVDACKLLRISDATAVRYFDELEKQGAIRQVGKTGRDCFYQPMAQTTA